MWIYYGLHFLIKKIIKLNRGKGGQWIQDIILVTPVMSRKTLEIK